MAGVDASSGDGAEAGAMATSLKVKENVELIRVSDGRHKYINPNYKKVQQKMYDYTCDIRLKVNEETFQAHRDVLSEASDYFAAMFSVDKRERQQDCIELYEISPKGFSSLLEYFYHGHITVTTEVVEDIIEAARFFQVDWLLDAVIDFLVRHLSIENYYEALELSDKYYLGDLRASIFHHIGQNFTPIAREGRFVGLSYDLFHKLLAEDYFIDSPEDYVLNTVVDWLAHDLPARKQHLVTLISCIRFCLLDEKTIRHLPEFVTENAEVKELIRQAEEYMANPAGQCLVEPVSASARGSYPVIAILPADDITRYMHFKVPGEDGLFSQKTDLQDLNTSLECASIVCLGNFIFLVGGYDRQYVSSRAVYRYDPRTISWLELTSMNDCRVTFGLCSTADSLVAVGGVELMLLEDGTDQEMFLETAEQYNPSLNMWTRLPSLPYRCYDLSVVSVGATAFVTGGVTDNPDEMIPINYCLSFCPGDEVWTPRSPMLIGRKGHSMTAVNGKIFVIGGSSAQTDVTYGDCWNNEMYDPETDQWTAIAPLTPDFGNVGGTTALLAGRIYFTCRKFGSQYLASYDPDKDEFSEKEYCGTHVQKLVPMRIGMPRDFYASAEPAANVAE